MMSKLPLYLRGVCYGPDAASDVRLHRARQVEVVGAAGPEAPVWTQQHWIASRNQHSTGLGTTISHGACVGRYRAEDPTRNA